MLDETALFEELAELERKLEQGGSSSYISDRMKTLRQRLTEPTIRQMTVGVRRGGLTKEQQKEIQMKQSVKEMLKLLEG